MKFRADFVTNSSSSSFISVSLDGVSASFYNDEYEGDGWDILWFQISDCLEDLAKAKTPDAVADVLGNAISWIELGGDEEAAKRDLDAFLAAVRSAKSVESLGVLSGNANYSCDGERADTITFNFADGEGSYRSLDSELIYDTESFEFSNISNSVKTTKTVDLDMEIYEDYGFDFDNVDTLIEIEELKVKDPDLMAEILADEEWFEYSVIEGMGAEGIFVSLLSDAEEDVPGSRELLRRFALIADRDISDLEAEWAECEE